MRKSEVTAIIIDDEDIIRGVYRALLEDLGVDVIGEAADGRTGVDLAVKLEPDLILLDVMMPKMNGYLALQEIVGRMHEPFVIMLTGVDDEDVKQGSMLEGSQGYIVKTEEPNKILEKLRRHVLFIQAHKKSK